MSCIKKGKKDMNLISNEKGKGGKKILGYVKEYVED